MITLFQNYTRCQELVLGLGLAMIGLLLLLPSASFDDSSTSQASASIAGEVVWGATMLVLGTAQVLAAVARKHQLRAAAAGAAALFWALGLAITLITAPTSTGVPFILVYTVLNACVLVFNLILARR